MILNKEKEKMVNKEDEVKRSSLVGNVLIFSRIKSAGFFMKKSARGNRKCCARGDENE